MRVNVQRKAVARDPVCIDLDADGGDFGWFAAVLRAAARAARGHIGLHPHTGLTADLPTDQPQAGQRCDQHFLQRADVTDVIRAGQFEQRVADQLAGAVIGDIPAAVHPMHAGPALFQFLRAP